MPNSKSKPQAAPEPVLRFKLARNVMLYDLAPYLGGLPPLPPTTMREERSIVRQTLVGSPDSFRPISVSPIIPTFDLDFVFEIKLEPVHPREVPREDGMSDAWFEKLQDREMTRALDARQSQETLRRTLVHYRDAGSIEIVDDPSHLLEQEPFLSEAEYRLRKELADHQRFAGGK